MRKLHLRSVSDLVRNDNDVIVVDDHVSPAAAWVLLIQGPGVPLIAVTRISERLDARRPQAR